MMFDVCFKQICRSQNSLPGKYDGGADDEGGPLRDLKSSM